MEFTMHDVCYAVEALKKYAATEEYRQEEVQATHKKFLDLFKLFISANCYTCTVTMDKTENAQKTTQE